MKDFTMSMYASEKELYKAKAEYYEQLLVRATCLLRDTNNFLGKMGAYTLEEKIDKFLEGLDE
jgi:hypothetical protein